MRKPRLWVAVATVVIAIVTLSACQPAAQPEPAAEGPEWLAALPHLGDLPEGWNRLRPGGETTCSDGSDYSFFVRAGDPAKVLFYLQGGGGCWTGDTCSPDRYGSFRPTVGDTNPAEGNGIFALDNPENPFADYTHVFVPYCTGDVHIGDRDVTYEVAAATPEMELREGQNPEAHQVTIHHRGHANVLAVLAWTYRELEPETVFVTGSSAGSIPSPYYAIHVAEHYPNARVAQLGDGAGGYRRSNGTQPFEPWGTLDVIDDQEAFRELGPEEFDWESLYIAAAKRRPDITFTEYDTAEDNVQKRFLALGGTPADSLQELLDANHADIEAEVPNFRSYVAGGELHTILGRPEFYTYETEGVRVRDWVAALAAGEAVEDVHCQECSTPGVAAAQGESTGG